MYQTRQLNDSVQENGQYFQAYVDAAKIQSWKVYRARIQEEARSSSNRMQNIENTERWNWLDRWSQLNIHAQGKGCNPTKKNV